MTRLSKLYALALVMFYPTTILLGADKIESAHFIETNEVVTSDVKPFTATSGSGNGGKLTAPNSGFVPIIYSTRYIVSKGTTSKVFVKQSAISQHDTLKSGALDSANVDIYRIANGSFTHVRSDTIPNDVFQVSGWFSTLKRDMVLNPQETEFTFSWDPWNRSGAAYHFSIRAIDKWGGAFRLREASNGSKTKKVTRKRNEIM